MSKHSLGPWSSACNEIRNADGGVVVYMTDLGTLTPRQAADARLIASAPDLLEALKVMVKEFGFEVIHPNGLVHDEAQAIRNAIDAIAKATGND